MSTRSRRSPWPDSGKACAAMTEFEKENYPVYSASQRRAKGAAVRTILLTAALVASSVAVGWGWGYNVRVSQECDGRGGSWNTFTQVCER